MFFDILSLLLRCFSAMGFLHNDRRNRLNSSTINKLMFVRSNCGTVECDGDDFEDSDGEQME